MVVTVQVILKIIVVTVGHVDLPLIRGDIARITFDAN